MSKHDRPVLDPEYIKLLIARINRRARALVDDCKAAGIVKFNAEAAGEDMSPSVFSRWYNGGRDSLNTAGRVLLNLGRILAETKRTHL